MSVAEVAPAVPGAGEASPALKLEVLRQCSTSKARVCSLELPHKKLELPVFMPVGTAGAVKGLTVEEMEAIGVPLILGNTYHLALRPTTELLEECGGLHKFMGWRGAMLTDSGGFQMVSLLKLAEISEEGVTFQSPSDGTKMLLTPERSIRHQNEIGADIIMALDDVVSSTTPSPERVKEAMHRTLRWIDRCIASHSRPDCQNLFGIVQGGKP
jgi:tRNA-guanine transglycosylase